MMKIVNLTGLFFVITASLCSQPGPTGQYLAGDLAALTGSHTPNVLTIYVIPSRAPYDWSSPRELYRSYVRNYRKNLVGKDHYLLGHAFIELSTPYSDSLILTGMRAASREDQKRLILEEHYGLSILGADVPGKLEPGSVLREKVERFSRKGRLAFMTFLINDAAARRMVEFFSQFKTGFGDGFKPAEHYGGAYYPRYYGEGAGCSAFVVSFLDLGGLMMDEFERWLVGINIPRDLIGGPYNPGNKVGLRDIRKSSHWADGSSESGNDYVPFQIYDPTLMFNWITDFHERHNRQHWNSKPVKMNNAMGILVDVRQEPAPDGESIFLEREGTSVFIDKYPSGLRK